ncbi:MAG: sulfatase-like hydrolase/transferase, partial [Planctomycetota bacterium]
MNKKLMWHLILSALCLFPILFSGCKTKDKPTKHVILISMDTTRADHLSCYGFDKKTTPNIDTFAKDSVLFEQCISPIPLTLPSHSSMLTGTNPVYHGVHNNDQYTLDKANTTLAERFKEKGYATGAVVSTFVLDRQFGMSQGFDTYDDTFRNPLVGPDEAERRGSETSQVAIEWLEKHQDEDFFLFLHYYDPHGAYQPPEPYATQFANDLYAGEIAYTDYCIQQVLDKLKALKIYDDALIIIVGDHGEGRGEHDEDSHGYYIYQSCIHVPLLVRFPGGQHENKRIEQTVGLVDLAPTICRWTELDPLSEYIGQDLTGYVEKNDIDERLLYSESLLPTKYGCSSLLSLTGDRWKYIQSSEPELYDLKNDPGELDNLIEPEAKRARLLQDELKLLIAEQVRETGSRSDQELDDESRKKLESLGYVAGGAVDEDFEFDTSKVPPREWIRVYEMSGECKTYLKFGLYPEAEKTVRRMIADKPFYVLNYYFLADAQQNQGKYTEAIATAREFLRRAEEKMQGLSEDQTMKPVDQFIPDIYMILGRCYFEMQQYDKAIEEYQHGLETADDEKAGKLLNNIGNVYMVQGQFDRALEKYVETIKLFPDFPQAHLNMGVIYAQRKEYENAQRA